jgi:hypothetical protein
MHALSRTRTDARTRLRLTYVPLQEVCALREKLSEAVRENETLQQNVTKATGDILQLAALICTNNYSAQGEFLQNCLSSAHSAQSHRETSDDASCEVSEGCGCQDVATRVLEGGENRSVNLNLETASSAVVDVGAAARELAAMMLLRYRFLQAEKKQAIAELEKRLQLALQEVSAGQQELAACHEQMEELAELSGRAHECEALMRAKVVDEMKQLVHERDRLVEEREQLLQEVKQAAAERQQVDKERQHLRLLCVQNSEKERQREREDAERLAHERASAMEREENERERAERESQAAADQARFQQEIEMLILRNKALEALCIPLAGPSSASLDREVYNSTVIHKRSFRQDPFGGGSAGRGAESHACRVGRGTGDSGGEVSREVPSLTACAHAAERRRFFTFSSSRGVPVSNDRTRPMRHAASQGSNHSLHSCSNSACAGLDYTSRRQLGFRSATCTKAASGAAPTAVRDGGADAERMPQLPVSPPGDAFRIVAGGDGASPLTREADRDSLDLSLR